MRTRVCNPTAVKAVEELHARSKGYSISVVSGGSASRVPRRRGEEAVVFTNFERLQQPTPCQMPVYHVRGKLISNPPTQPSEEPSAAGDDGSGQEEEEEEEEEAGNCVKNPAGCTNILPEIELVTYNKVDDWGQQMVDNDENQAEVLLEEFGLQFPGTGETVSIEMMPQARYEIAPISVKADITIIVQISTEDPTWVDVFYCGWYKPSPEFLHANGINTLFSSAYTHTLIG